MNWDHINNNWEHLKESIKQQLNKLTDAQLELIAGKRDQFTLALQKLYALSKEEADKQLDVWQEQQNEAAYLSERATERNGTQVSDASSVTGAE